MNQKRGEAPGEVIPNIHDNSFCGPSIVEFMCAIFACVRKQRYSNREKFYVRFQFQERQKKKSLKQRKGRHISQKERFRGRMKWGQKIVVKVERKEI